MQIDFVSLKSLVDIIYHINQMQHRVVKNFLGLAAGDGSSASCFATNQPGGELLFR